MNTHLRNFKTYTAYKAAYNNGEIDLLHVAHADNNDTCYFSKLMPIVRGPESTPGAIHLYNNITGLYKTVYREDYVENYEDSEEWIAIGIVVIPKDHNVYGTGEGALISLQEMSYSTPNTGTNSTRQPMYWKGGSDYALSGLPVRNFIGCLGHNAAGWTPDNELDHVNLYGYMPSDKISSENWNLVISNPYDIDGDITTSWLYNNEDCHIASPYLNGSDRNPVYYSSDEMLNYVSMEEYYINIAKTAGFSTIEEYATFIATDENYVGAESLEVVMEDCGASTPLEFLINCYGFQGFDRIGGNITGDFAGKSNTEYLNSLNDSLLANWKTTVSLSNGIFYVAAACCARYGVEGLEAGNWYLPAAGELGYMMARFHQIQLSLAAVGALTIRTLSGYWSSTECSASDAVRLGTGDGYINWYGKDYGNCVRAFARF